MYSPQIQKPRVLSVSQINFYIKSIIENDGSLQFVLVTGEISNLTVHQRSGHIYLSLKEPLCLQATQDDLSSALKTE